MAALTVYAALGGSRVLSVGPESTVALTAGATVAPLAGGDPARAVALRSALAFIVAGWCLIARIVRLGVASDLLSTPLLVGYLAGGAVLMVVGQLGRLTGTKVSGEGVADGLRDLHSDLAKQGVRLGLARLKNDVRTALERANLVELIGADMMFPTLPVMEQAYLAWASEHPYPDMPQSTATSTTVAPRHLAFRRSPTVCVTPPPRGLLA